MNSFKVKRLFLNQLCLSEHARHKIQCRMASVRMIEENPEKYYTGKTTQNSTRLYVWGLAEHGALGEIKIKGRKLGYCDVHRPLRKNFSFSHKIIDFACGYGFTLYSVRHDKYKLFGSGLNTDSQIGYHAPRSGHPLGVIYSIVPITLPLHQRTTTQVIKVAAGRAHSVALTDAEGVFLFGNNSFGQCGKTILEDEDYLVWKDFTHYKDLNGERVVDIVCGQDHSLFLTETGKVYSCGCGADGQTGLGHYNNTSKPTLVQGDIKDEKIIKLSSSTDTVLALNDKGEVFGWGNTEYFQLLTPDYIQQLSTPMYIKRLQPFGKIRDIAAGGTACIILTENRQVYVWGFGLLGKGPELMQSETPSLIPATIFGRNQFQSDVTVDAVSCGVKTMAAITNHGDLYTWGPNQYGQLGLGKIGENIYFPLKVSIGARVLKVSCGMDHMMALCKSFI